MKKLILGFLISFSLVSQAQFRDLQTVREFQDLIATAAVPVVVQFHASWCGPCHSLSAVFGRVSQQYSDNQVIIAKIDADIHSQVSHYLLGGYPTVRTFENGMLLNPSFTGSQSDSYVISFIDSLLQTGSFPRFLSSERGDICQP